MLALALVACSFGSSATSQGNLEVRITDHREVIEDFNTLDVTISGLAIHPAGATRDQEWQALQPLERQIDLARIGYIAVNPAQPDEMVFATFGRDIYLSQDDGQSWKQIARAGKGQS